MHRKNERLSYEVLPPPETPVWRYLSLAKLLALFRTSSVFLCRADLFDDPFEGTFSEGSLRNHMEDWGTEFPEKLVDLARWAPCRSFVSCWHASDVESAALWKIYASSEGSLAITSTVGGLQAAFPERLEESGNVLLNQAVRSVQYIDYRTEHPHLNDVMGPLCYKRRAFAYEQEIRVIRQELPTGPAKNRPNGRAILRGSPPDHRGIEVGVDLPALISAVYVAPSSPSWLFETVRDTIRKFDLEVIPCRQSGLDELPDFGRLGA